MQMTGLLFPTCVGSYSWFPPLLASKELPSPLSYLSYIKEKETVFLREFSTTQRNFDLDEVQISRAGTPQRGNLKSYSCSLNVEHFERKESASL
jgi:hypothetical protein